MLTGNESCNDKPGQVSCPSCRRANPPALKAWHFSCGSCGFEYSTLDARPESPASDVLDEELRTRALDALRTRNAEAIVSFIEANVRSSGRRLLDVGCAYGWFLEVASKGGYSVTGVEPEEAIARHAKAKGFQVLVGRFPEVVPLSEKFDVVTFNDVLEHIPDPKSVLVAVRDRLSAGGCVSIVVPLRTGIFYKTARFLARGGWSGPFMRMWQVAFHSPHLSYFSQADLSAMAAEAGLVECGRQYLPSIRIAGLWSRLRYDKGSPIIFCALAWLLIALIRPFFIFLPADIGHFVYRKN